MLLVLGYMNLINEDPKEHLDERLNFQLETLLNTIISLALDLLYSLQENVL